jgi:hypothetical protein
MLIIGLTMLSASTPLFTVTSPEPVISSVLNAVPLARVILTFVLARPRQSKLIVPGLPVIVTPPSSEKV